MTSAETLARIERACAELREEGEGLTFTAVAARAGISRPTLYRDVQLRAVVEEHIHRGHDPRTLSGLTSEVGHLRIAMEELAARVRTHEEQIRQLSRTDKRRQAR